MAKMTDTERAAATQAAAVAGLDAMRAGDRSEANQLFAHAVHDGCTPFEIIAEVIAQTGGEL